MLVSPRPKDHHLIGLHAALPYGRLRRLSL